MHFLSVWCGCVTLSCNCVGEKFPSKQHLYNICAMLSKTLGRRCTNVILMFCVCWVTFHLPAHHVPACQQTWGLLSVGFSGGPTLDDLAPH